MGLLDEALAFIDARKRSVANAGRDIAADPVQGIGLLGQRIGGALTEGAQTQLQAADRMGSVMPTEQQAGLAQMIPGLLGMAPMGIVSPKVANTLKFDAALPVAREFPEAVANTKGAQITPEGLLMRVQRNQLPEQGMQESVRGGVFYLPEGAAQAKHYSTGKNGYGGSERISGETLLKNPLFAKGGTGGKAPEAAYDSLLGKGAYQDMRTEAINTQRWAGGGLGRPDQGKTAEQVQAFLEKHAPELADQADYIVSSSGKGNQLAYALQEAAVASAVRRAGHDAVLGFSKGRGGNGHFLSELFDVRESHYPDKFGGSKVWPDLFK